MRTGNLQRSKPSVAEVKTSINLSRAQRVWIEAEAIRRDWDITQVIRWAIDQAIERSKREVAVA